MCSLVPGACNVRGQPVAVCGASNARLIKVSRTIADLAGADRIERPHLAEAASYRAFDPDASAPMRPTAMEGPPPSATSASWGKIGT